MRNNRFYMRRPTEIQLKLFCYTFIFMRLWSSFQSYIMLTVMPLFIGVAVGFPVFLLIQMKTIVTTRLHLHYTHQESESKREKIIETNKTTSYHKYNNILYDEKKNRQKENNHCDMMTQMEMSQICCFGFISCVCVKQNLSTTLVFLLTHWIEMHTRARKLNALVH